MKGLTAENAVYQFASTAPGTYQVMNIGRFVKSFDAFDGRGTEGAGRADLGEPVEALERTPGPNDPVHCSGDVEYRRSTIRSISCAGPRSRSDHVLINPHAVIGYPSGMQTTPVRLRLSYPAGWKVGTALDRAKDGAYMAKDFDQLVDSPILLGRLTTAADPGDRGTGPDLHLLQTGQDHLDPTCSAR